MEPLTLVFIGIFLLLAWEVDGHLRRIVATLEARPVTPQPSGAATNTVAPAAPIPPTQPTGPVPLTHSFSGNGDRPPEVEILQRQGEEWACLGKWQEGHPDLEHGKRIGFAIRRGETIEEGTE